MPASQLQATALAQYQKGNFPEAAKSFEQAAEAYRAEGDRAMVAEMGSNLGVSLRALKDYARAAAVLDAAVAEFRALNDSHRLALALGNLGSVLLESNDLPRAGDVLNESLSLLDPEADKDARSEVLRVLGEVRLKQGRYMDGLVNYEAGLRDVEKRTAQQNWLLKLLQKPLRMLGRK
ncbi:MAG TPA: tetratricopeptide repeat protein [Anaerolineales bacterium]|nr:tetratricopeptide repeat protein [Anaerolineales bacterium]